MSWDMADRDESGRLTVQGMVFKVSKTILTVKELLAPLDRDEIKLVRCLGLNYADHAVCLLRISR